MSDGIELLVVIGDLHCGSTLGLCPPAVTVEGGGEYKANSVQKWMWEQWEDATGCLWTRKKSHGEDEMPGQISMPKRDGWIRKIIGKRRAALIVNGDAIEGTHHHSVEVIGNDVALHRRIASHVLSPLAEYFEKVYVVRGTEVHVGTSESMLGQELGGVYCDATKAFCWEQLQLRVNDVLVHVKHHIGTSMRPWTTSMQFAAAISSEQLNAVGLDHEVPRVVCRAHRHQFGEFRHNQGMIVVGPPWQMMTRFARKVTQASLSQPGLYVLDFADLDCYGLPALHAKLYRPDPDETLTI